MQLTTREAVENLLFFAADNTNGQWIAGDKNCESVALLCDYYGFKLEQFFDVEAVE